MEIRTLDAEMWLPLEVQTVFQRCRQPRSLDAAVGAVQHPDAWADRIGPGNDYRLSAAHPLRADALAVGDHLVGSTATVVDEQLSGPYKVWVHRHDFEQRDGGTWVRDHVDCRPRGWICEPLINRVLVTRDLKAIFEYRQQRIRELLAPGSFCAQDRVDLG